MTYKHGSVLLEAEGPNPRTTAPARGVNDHLGDVVPGDGLAPVDGGADEGWEAPRILQQGCDLK